MSNIINDFSEEHAFLSNFYESPIEFSYGKNTYIAKTVEHYFQASKPTSLTEIKDILNLKTAGQSKRAGRHCSLRNDWESAKVQIMREALEKKFSSAVLKEKLLKTGDAILVEGNVWHDNYWGNCTCDRCKNITGKNTLGKLLMEIRSKLIV